jgi:hypothetical protein
MGLADLSVHAFRLIPDGTNSPASPWRISLSCQDSGVAPLVIPEQYTHFAQALNAAVEWNNQGWETWCHWILLACWYPLAAEFLSWRRDVRASRLVDLVRDEEGQRDHHQMLSGHRARVLHNCLRLNISDDCTMFWLDVLYRETAPAPVQMRRTVGAPRLPMLLCLSGDGTSHDPLHLDLNDVLINSIPQLTVLSDFIDNRWVDFVLSLNEALRTVDCDHLRVTIGPVLRLIDRSNEGDYLNGLHLQMVLMWPNATQLPSMSGMSSMESSMESHRESSVESHMESSTSMEWDHSDWHMPDKYEVEGREARLAVHIAMGRPRRNSRFGHHDTEGGDGACMYYTDSTTCMTTNTDTTTTSTLQLTDTTTCILLTLALLRQQAPPPTVPPTVWGKLRLHDNYLFLTIVRLHNMSV